MVVSEKLRKHLIPLTFLAVSILIIFWNLFTLDQAFLSGDHREQQYPWAKFYQAQIQQHQLPWWTTHIQSGFPILAEGQIGAFYPINFLTFYFLPMKVAYNYGILLHYFVGALFFYFYLQHLKISRWGGFFSTLIFLFGSTQGGYFYYNYISQKVVIWLPACLWLIERILAKNKGRDVFLLALVYALEIFGGYLQVAVYTILFSTCYFLIRWFQSKREWTTLGLFLFAGVLGLLISAVQIGPTYELALFSSRANAVKDIAYIGSMTPLGFLTLFYPSWDGFLGSEWYLGLLGFFFFLWSFTVKNNSISRAFLILTILFLLLALGEWSPLYRGIIELTGFGGFRTPIKFLFFVTFSMAVLSAFGWDQFWSHERTRPRALPTRLFIVIAAVLILFPPVLERTLTLIKPQMLPRFEELVIKKFHGKAGHPHQAEVYREKARGYYKAVQDQTDVFKDRHAFREWQLLAAVLVFVWAMSRSIPSNRWKIFATLFLFLDLYFYGFTSIRPNLESFDTIDNPRRESGIVTLIKEDDSLYRVTELFTPEAQEKRLPLFPSLNMIYEKDDLGIYSPLAMKSYKEFLAGWGGYINDSLSATPVKKEKMLSRIEDLQKLNVKYLISREALSHPMLTQKVFDKETFLYEISNPMPRMMFSGTLPDSFEDFVPDDSVRLTMKDYSQQHVSLQVDTRSAGYVLLSDTYYPGWKAWVDHSPQPILSWAGIFRAVKVEPGTHEIVFKYDPTAFRLLSYFSAAIVLLGSLFFLTRKRTCHET